MAAKRPTTKNSPKAKNPVSVPIKKRCTERKVRKDKGGKHKAPESKLQAQCIAHAQKQKQGLLRGLIVLNTSSMHGFAGQAMRVTGSKGVADLLIFHRGAGNSGALFVEFKIGKNQLSDPQLEYFGKLTAEGYCCRTVRSLDEFKNVLFNYLFVEDYDLPESGRFGGTTDRDHYEAGTARGIERVQQFREYLQTKLIDPPFANSTVPASDTRRLQFYELEHGFDAWLQSRAPIDVDADSLFEFDAESP